jgi:hypothetical protein
MDPLILLTDSVHCLLMGCFKFPSNVDHEVAAEVWFTLCFTMGKAPRVQGITPSFVHLEFNNG